MRYGVMSVEQAKSWLDIQSSDKDWFSLTEKASTCTEHIGSPVYLEEIKGSVQGVKEVAVVAMDTWKCSYLLNILRESGKIPANSKIVLHNFADAKYPGGYFAMRNGGAQEESLCAFSALYPVISNHKYDYDDCYNAVRNVKHAYLNSRFAPVLYSPDVPTSKEWGSTKDFYLCDYVTAAFLNLRHADKAGDYDEQSWARISTVLSTVLKNAGDVPTYFVTGAWGCGVFKNEARHVFGDYKKYLDQVANPNGNVTVIFAVPGGSNLDCARAIF